MNFKIIESLLNPNLINMDEIKKYSDKLRVFDNSDYIEVNGILETSLIKKKKFTLNGKKLLITKEVNRIDIIKQFNNLDKQDMVSHKYQLIDVVKKNFPILNEDEQIKIMDINLESILYLKNLTTVTNSYLMAKDIELYITSKSMYANCSNIINDEDLSICLNNSKYLKSRSNSSLHVVFNLKDKQVIEYFKKIIELKEFNLVDFTNSNLMMSQRILLPLLKYINSENIQTPNAKFYYNCFLGYIISCDKIVTNLTR